MGGGVLNALDQTCYVDAEKKIDNDFGLHASNNNQFQKEIRTMFLNGVNSYHLDNQIFRECDLANPIVEVLDHVTTLPTLNRGRCI